MNDQQPEQECRTCDTNELDETIKTIEEQAETPIPTGEEIPF